jgi:integral membrane sensor domain MASE1
VLLLAGWAGNLVANRVARGWVLGLVLYGAINMGQTLLAAHFVRRSRVGDDVMADSGSFGRFLFWARLIAPALGAAAGALSSQMIYGQPLLPSFARWIASNSLGFVIFTPFFKGIFDGSYARALSSLKKITLAENLAVFGLHVAVTLLVFAQNRLPLLYLPFSTLLLLTFRMGRLATHLGTLLVAVVAIIAALNHSGPMALIDQGPLIQTVFLQAYLAVLLCTSLPVAAVVSARADAQAELAAREETCVSSWRALPTPFSPSTATGSAVGPMARCANISASSRTTSSAPRSPNSASRPEARSSGCITICSPATAITTPATSIPRVTPN